VPRNVTDSKIRMGAMGTVSVDVVPSLRSGADGRLAGVDDDCGCPRYNSGDRNGRM
jgi:hypothetical protein